MNSIRSDRFLSASISWRAATLGTPCWLAATVAAFFVAAPIVRRVESGASDIAVEFAAIIAVCVVSLAVAVTLFVRSGSARWRGFAIGMMTAAVLAIEFGAIHFGVNVNAEYVTAP